MTTMELPLSVYTELQPNGLRRIVWADGTPLGQRQWRRAPQPAPRPKRPISAPQGTTSSPTGTDTAPAPSTGAPVSLLAVLREVGHGPQLDRQPGTVRNYAGLRWETPQQRARREAAGEAPSGAQLREWRETLGLSQRDAAALSGTSRGMIASLELGLRAAPVTRQRVGVALRRALGIAP